MERRYSHEFRRDGRRLSGTVVKYGDTALIGGRMREQFEPGAFDVRSIDATLNEMHDPQKLLARTGTGGMKLTDSPEGLSMVAELGRTRQADDTLENIDRGILTGLSMEFAARSESYSGDLRRVLRADLGGIAVVDRPAYEGSTGLSVRRQELRIRGRGVTGALFYDRNQVIADRGAVRKRRFKPGAFRETLQDESREVLLLVGPDNGQPLASRLAGTLRLTDTAEAIRFDVDELPAVTYAQDLRELLTAGTVQPGVVALYRVPPADVVPNAIEQVPDPDAEGVLIEVVNEAILTALVVRYRGPRADGLPTGEVEVRRRKRRRLLWLLQ